MALNGDYGLQRPDFGVYADTGSEPEFINEYVQYYTDLVKSRYGFEILYTKRNNGLADHLLNGKLRTVGTFFSDAAPPFYTLNKNGTKGMLMRQCTSEFKKNPLTKLINSRKKRGEYYNLQLGMSIEEQSRMKVSGIKFRTNIYPLVEKRIRRIDSINYVKDKGLRKPQRSSCYFCPFHSDRYWLWLKKEHKETFLQAVEFEYAINKRAESFNDIRYFCHKKCIPLDFVKFDNEDQLNMFPELIDECDGYCGI